METESARWNPFRDKKQDTAPEDRPLEPGDRKNAILHLGNLIKAKLGLSQGDDDSLKNFREKVPDSVKKAYAAVEKAAKGNKPAQRALKKAKYVNEMLESIDAVYELTDDEGEPLPASEAFDAAAEAFCETLLEALPKKSRDELEDYFSQLGGEVVLTKDDLA
jgi:hypothetical protein